MFDEKEELSGFGKALSNFIEGLAVVLLVISPFCVIISVVQMLNK